MRALVIAGLLTTLVGCAAAPSITTPREYVDEQTAATITVVADPLVFAQDPTAVGRDFLNVYAIDVNRMGSHQQYLAVLQWWPDRAKAANADTTTLQLQTPGRTLSFSAITQTGRELGIAQQLDPTAPRDAQWFYFPVGKEDIAQVSKAAGMRATLVREDSRRVYDLWEDKRAEMAELAEALP